MKILQLIITFVIFLSSSNLFANENQENCTVDDNSRKEILDQISNGNIEILNKLAPCYSLDRKLIIKASLINANQFKNAHEILKKDEGFVHRLIKVNPDILQFADDSLLSNENFMKEATYLYRDALKYANPKLLDNEIFMEKMIKNDSKNYLFASENIKSNKKIAKIAFSDNGTLLSNAPDLIKSDKNLVKIAMISNLSAFESASPSLKSDKMLINLYSKKNNKKIDQDELKEFLEKNYLKKEEKRNLGSFISNRGKFAKKNIIINNNYITKWTKESSNENQGESGKLILFAINKRNYASTWKEDLKNYPNLINKIEQFFLKRNLDQNTIDSLSTTYFWEIKNHPKTYVLNLYLMRNSLIEELGNEFVNITSFTAIVQKIDKEWKLSVVEVIFDSEVKADVAYSDGHKKYIVWDIYDKKKDPKVIFKVEDKFNNYFQIYSQESQGKYQPFSRIEIDLKNK